MWQISIRSRWTVFGAGLLVGSAAAPVIGLVVRPLLLGVVKAGLLLQEEGSALMEEIKEELEDIVAEARSEITEGLPATRKAHAHDSRGRSDTAA
jgi:hypothetical protein